MSSATIMRSALSIVSLGARSSASFSSSASRLHLHCCSPPSLIRSSVAASTASSFSSFHSPRRFSSASTSSPSAAPVAFQLRAGDKYTVDAFVSEKSEQGKYVQETVSRGKHQSIIDERGLYSGGLDLGLSPYDLLLSGLGGCTSMTLRMYADRRSIPLGPLRIELMHGKKPAAEVQECEERGLKGMIDLIEVTLHLQAATTTPPASSSSSSSVSASSSLELTSTMRAELLAIANKCPVHQTLAGNPRTIIRTRIA